MKLNECVLLTDNFKIVKKLKCQPVTAFVASPFIEKVKNLFRKKIDI
jgi:hypothetical protein